MESVKKFKRSHSSDSTESAATNNIDDTFPHPDFFAINKPYLPGFLKTPEKYYATVKNATDNKHVQDIFDKYTISMNKRYPPPSPRRVWNIMTTLFNSIKSKHAHLKAMKIHYFIKPNYVLDIYTAVPDIFKDMDKWIDFVHKCDTQDKFESMIKEIKQFYEEQLATEERLDPMFRLINHCRLIVALEHPDIATEILSGKDLNSLKWLVKPFENKYMRLSQWIYNERIKKYLLDPHLCEKCVQHYNPVYIPISDVLSDTDDDDDVQQNYEWEGNSFLLINLLTAELWRPQICIINEANITQ